MAAIRKRHARYVARRFAAEVLRATEIVCWASDKSDLSEQEIAVAADELERIADRIDEQRAAQAAQGGEHG